MKKIILILTIGFLGAIFAMSPKNGQTSDNKVDDWDYNATVEMYDSRLSTKSRAMMPAPAFSNSGAAMMKSASMESLGLAVGGAKDANNFYENIKNNYLPKLSSITYEGVFYDHFFDTQKDEICKALFCPIFTTAVTNNIYTKEKEYFLSVGLNSGMKESDFKRKKLNLVVVLDISGSMGSSFNRYYYDKSGKVEIETKEAKKTKMKIANESIAAMMDHLNKEDSFGVVLFDNVAYKAKPLRSVAKTDMNAIKKHIIDLKQRGGTNWGAGYKEGIKLFESLKEGLRDPKEYENRIIFLTDAMPNLGELNKDGLFGLAKEASKNGIYTSFIGIGVDFNNDLVEYITKTKGANYYSVHSSKEFKTRMDDEFDYMVTPLVFDLNLKVLSKGFEIEAVYGSPEADRTTGEVMQVNTLFPSKSEEGEVKGGIVLIKLKQKGDAKDIKLSLTYKDRSNQEFVSKKEIKLDEKEHFENSAMQKAILLSYYTTLMKNWLIDMRKGCNDIVEYPHIIPLARRCMIYPPDREEYPRIKTWERKSCPLTVSEGYKNIFSLFKNHFENEMKTLKDKSLEKEYDLINDLLGTKTEKNGKTDDWQLKR